MTVRLLSLIVPVFLLPCAESKAVEQVGKSHVRPNIILIISDQLNWSCFSGMGDKHVKTPHIDRLLSRGVRFERAYAMNPVCIPSRISMFTGLRPSRFGFHVPKPGIDFAKTEMRAFVKERNIAGQFQKSGYKTYYGGKTHFGVRGNEFHPADMGFEVYAESTECRGQDCVPKATAVLKQHKSRHGESPFLLVASLINPHDICYVHIKDHRFDLDLIKKRSAGAQQKLLRESLLSTLKIPEGVQGAGGYEPIDYYLKNAPSLPDNSQPQAGEPSIISGEGETGGGMAAEFGRYRGQYDSTDWLLHRFAYTRFVEVIDREIGLLLKGLEESGLAENSYIVLTSDHGEQLGSHQMAGKGLFYDEACHVPFIVSHERFSGGRVDRTTLVNNGLDLLPTLFDLAGVECPMPFEGKSLAGVLRDPRVKLDRQYVPVEFSTGMGIIAADFYYGIYYNGKANNEQLYDIRKLPLQMVNDAPDPDYAEQLRIHRQAFKQVHQEVLKSYRFPPRFMKYLD